MQEKKKDLLNNGLLKRRQTLLVLKIPSLANDVKSKKWLLAKLNSKALSEKRDLKVKTKM